MRNLENVYQTTKMVYRDEHLRVTDMGQKGVTLLDFFSVFVMRE